MPKELTVPEPRKIELVDYQETSLQPDEVRVAGVMSGISHGTEMNLYRGVSPFEDKEFDMNLRLFVDRKEKADSGPLRLGYEWVGRVTEVGSEVTTYKPGDLIHAAYNHRETQTFQAGASTWMGRIDPLPQSIQPEQAVILALAGVALQCIHDGHVKVGDHVVVFGLGAIGLLAVQLAKLNGAKRVDAVDPIAARRELALTYGADRVFDPASEDVGYAIKSTSANYGPDLAIELSGSYAALHDAIRTVRMGGTVVAGAYYTGEATALRLGEEWHHNRVTLVSSMGVWLCPHRDYPLWDRQRIHETVVDLLATGRLNTIGLVTHRIPFVQAQDAYNLIDHHPEEVVKVVLTY